MGAGWGEFLRSLWARVRWGFWRGYPRWCGGPYTPPPRPAKPPRGGTVEQAARAMSTLLRASRWDTCYMLELARGVAARGWMYESEYRYLYSFRHPGEAFDPEEKTDPPEYALVYGRRVDIRPDEYPAHRPTGNREAK